MPCLHTPQPVLTSTYFLRSTDKLWTIQYVLSFCPSLHSQSTLQKWIIFHHLYSCFGFPPAQVALKLSSQPPTINKWYFISTFSNILGEITVYNIWYSVQIERYSWNTTFVNPITHYWVFSYLDQSQQSVMSRPVENVNILLMLKYVLELLLHDLTLFASATFMIVKYQIQFSQWHLHLLFSLLQLCTILTTLWKPWTASSRAPSAAADFTLH